jgi:hypothetical protein
MIAMETKKSSDLDCKLVKNISFLFTRALARRVHRLLTHLIISTIRIGNVKQEAQISYIKISAMFAKSLNAFLLSGK